jgi:hypothetical protein
LVVETVRVMVNAIEAVAAEWLKQNVPASWAERYAQPAHSERLVKERGEKGRAAANALAQQIGQDGVWLYVSFQYFGDSRPGSHARQ